MNYNAQINEFLKNCLNNYGWIKSVLNFPQRIVCYAGKHVFHDK